MKKQKVELTDISVTSFVTNGAAAIKGGNTGETHWGETCGPSWNQSCQTDRVTLCGDLNCKDDKKKDLG